MNVPPLLDSQTHRRYRNIVIAMLGTALLVAYWPALQAGFIWDDDLWLTSNPTLRTFHGLGRIWTDLDVVPEYYPLTLTTFWAEFQLWGVHPFGYHFDNLVLHAANAVLVAVLLKRLGVRGANVAAALFAFHPVNVESVAWVTERKNTLSGFFALSASLYYLRFHVREERRFYVAALVLFAAALLAKTVVVTVPAVLLVILWWKQGRLRPRDLARIAPFFLLSLSAGAFAVWMQHHHTGASGIFFRFTPVDRLLIAARALGFYALKVFLPVQLMFIYPCWPVRPHAAWQFVLLGTILCVPMVLWINRRRFGRGPLAALLIFAGVLFPALGFFNVYWQIYSFVADHMLYLACIPLLALFAAGLSTPTLPKIARNGIAGGICLAFAGLTFYQAQDYNSALDLWTATAARNPGSWMVRTNLAHALLAEHRAAEAAEQYRVALSLAPQVPDVQRNVGIVFARAGNYLEAARYFRISIDDDPQFAAGYESLARAYIAMNQPDKAMAVVDEGIAACPGSETMWAARGDLLEKAGRTDEAITAYRKAIEIRPSLGPLRLRFGNLFVATHQLDAAQEQLTAATENLPESAEAWTNLGGVQLARGNAGQAAESFRVALRFDAKSAAAQRGLQISEAMLRANGASVPMRE